MRSIDMAINKTKATAMKILIKEDCLQPLMATEMEGLPGQSTTSSTTTVCSLFLSDAAKLSFWGTCSLLTEKCLDLHPIYFWGPYRWMLLIWQPCSTKNSSEFCVIWIARRQNRSWVPLLARLAKTTVVWTTSAISLETCWTRCSFDMRGNF